MAEIFEIGNAFVLLDLEELLFVSVHRAGKFTFLTAGFKSKEGEMEMSIDNCSDSDIKFFLASVEQKMK